jgi:hypothetical protein
MVSCGRDPDFAPPAREDMRVTLDLAASASMPADFSCATMMCGACSSFVNFDGKPSKPGDPCGWNGSYQCMGDGLVCNVAARDCPACGGTMSGSLCGADGHTIVEIVTGSNCKTYDFGSAISVCNHGANDHCVDRCTKIGSSYACVARCLSDDGGATGCEHKATDTCDTLTSC